MLISINFDYCGTRLNLMAQINENKINIQLRKHDIWVYAHLCGILQNCEHCEKGLLNHYN